MKNETGKPIDPRNEPLVFSEKITESDRTAADLKLCPEWTELEDEIVFADLWSSIFPPDCVIETPHLTHFHKT